MSSHSTRLAYLGNQGSEAKAPATVRPSVWASLRAMWLTRQTRRLLAEMDDHSLADIGLGRGDATMEAARPMWDINLSAR